MTTPQNQTPAFSDSLENDRQQPSQTQGDSPRANTPEENSDYQEWLREREANKPVEKSAKTVDSGRSAAPTKASKSEAPEPVVEEDEVPQSYVWLANGEVLLADDEDLPGNAGHGAYHGYWQRDGKVHTVVAVYPVETTLKES